MSFSERLKSARVNKGLSQSELGKRVNIHYTQIGRYEKKGAQPSAEVLQKLAQALEVSSDFLINGTAEEKAHSNLSDVELINQFKAIELMDEEDRFVVKKLIDAFITKKKIQALAS